MVDEETVRLMIDLAVLRRLWQTVSHSSRELVKTRHFFATGMFKNVSIARVCRFGGHIRGRLQDGDLQQC